MRRRLALLTVAPLVMLLAATSGAAAKPQIVDPKGDSVGGQGAIDIVSVTYTTVGSGSGKAYVPKKLVITLTLAAPPLQSPPGVSYTVSADTSTCGVFSTEYAPGNVAGTLIGEAYSTFGSCAASIWHPVKVKGSTITIEHSLKTSGLDRGTEFTDFAAAVDASDPALAALGSNGGVLDAAKGTGVWRVP